MMMHAVRRMIIFTDLDGSLLDHGNYSWAHARPALSIIRDRDIPVIICTSKTFPEVALIQQEIGLTGPFIVENGGGVFFPGDFKEFSDIPVSFRRGCPCIDLGKPYDRIRGFFKELQRYFSIRGFGDMTTEEVGKWTNLSMEKAAMAKTRDFTEPFLLGNEDELDALLEVARNSDYRITKGGRFYHLSACGSDKGRAVTIVSHLFSRKWGFPPRSVGLGDSPNDFSMLAQVDIPVLIPHDGGNEEAFALRNLIRAPYPGSRGWNAAVTHILQNSNPAI